MADPQRASVPGGGPIPAGPIKIKWIKIVNDGTTNRVFYEGDSTGSPVFHYFNLAGNTAMVTLLADCMAAGTATVNWATDTGPSLYFISSDKVATPPGVPKLPTAGVVHHLHDNVTVS